MRRVRPGERSLRIRLDTLARVAGTVTFDGRNIGGARIEVTGVTLSERTMSDARGEFAFEGLRPGEYRLKVEFGDLGDALELAVTAGQTSTVQLELAPRPRVRGRVMSNGVPVEGADISIVETSSTGYLRFGRMTSDERRVTNESGHFDVAVDVGEWTLVVSLEPHDRPPSTATFSIGVGETTDLGMIEYSVN